MGRLTKEQEREIVDLILNKPELSLTRIAAQYGISYMRLYQVQIENDAFRSARRPSQPMPEIKLTKAEKERLERDQSLAKHGFDVADFSRRWRETTGKLRAYDEKVKRRKLMQELTYTDSAGAKYKVWESVKDGKTGFGICFKSPGKETKWRPWSKTFYEKSVDAFAVLRDEARRKGWWQV